MTREEAKTLTLKWLEEGMKRNSKSMDDIFVIAPHVGKDSWTYAEYKDAVENDKPLCGLEGETTRTPIDDTLSYVRHCEEHGKKYE